jgi:serine/threonine protein kinase
MSVDDFDLLNLVGRGSFGKVRRSMRVCTNVAKTSPTIRFRAYSLRRRSRAMQVMQVRKKDTGAIYAMKVLSKKHIVLNNEVEHTKAERNILEKLNHPFLMNLVYSCGHAMIVMLVR